MQKPTLYKKGYMSPLHVFSFKNCFTCTSGDLIFYSTLTLNIVWNFLLINLTIFERNCRIYAICIFVKKQGSKLFSSNGRVNIFSAESKKIFVKKQPHPQSPIIYCTCWFLLQKKYILLLPMQHVSWEQAKKKCTVPTSEALDVFWPNCGALALAQFFKFSLVLNSTFKIYVDLFAKLFISKMYVKGRPYSLIFWLCEIHQGQGYTSLNEVNHLLARWFKGSCLKPGLSFCSW